MKRMTKRAILALIPLAFALSLAICPVCFADEVPSATDAASTDETAVLVAASSEDAESSEMTQLATDPSTTSTPTSSLSEDSSGSSTTTTSISGATVTLAHAALNCTGTALTPGVSISLSGVTLVEGTDYVVLYNDSTSAPSAAGSYTVTVKGIGSYSGTVSAGTFTIYSALTDSGDYRVYNSANSSLVLDASGKNPTSGANVSAYTSNGGSNQLWQFTLNSDGTYTVTSSANSSLVLDASGKSPKSGANVSAYTSNSGSNQRWILEVNSDGSYIIRSAANGALVLDASGKSPVSGANVSAYTYNGGANQLWILESLQSVYATLDELAKDNESAIADGSYTIYSAISTHNVVAVSGSNAQTAVSTAAATQKWIVSHDSQGYVLLQNASTGKYLSVANATAASGANVIQSDSTERASKWIFVLNSDGTYDVRSALYTNLSLDVYRASSAAGTNLEIYTTLRNSAQRFSVIITPANVDSCTEILDSSAYYRVKSTVSSDYQLDLTGASKSDGTAYEIWSSNNTLWQLFRFKYVDGYYRIIDAYSGKALSVEGSSLVPGGKVVSATVSTSANQLWSVIQNSDGTYSFVNKKSGLVLGSASDSASSLKGSAICQQIASSSAAQMFTLSVVENLLSEGLFRLTNAANTGLSLDVTGASTAEGTNVEVWKNNTAFAQKWYAQLVSGQTNTYTLQAVCSGKNLAVSSSGSNVVQASASSTDTAQWWVPSISNGAYVFTNVATKLVLDAAGKSPSSGANVSGYEANGGANQRWNVTSVNPVDNGIYFIRSLVDSSKVFDVKGASTANNAELELWKNNGGGNQKFRLTRNSDGTYTIVNCASGKALDASGASSTEGTQIIQYTKSGNANQCWNIVYTGDGGFKLVSTVDSSVVIAFGSSASNGALLSLASDTDEKVQHYTFKATSYSYLTSDQQAMLNRIAGQSSGTQWLIAVNRGTHKVGVFKGSAGNWSLQYYWSCVTGASGTPTITGTYYTTGGKKSALSTDSRAIYCTQIWNGYYFHSVLNSESELGQSLSHGCIRMAYSSANWIYKNIWAGTAVVIYN